MLRINSRPFPPDLEDAYQIEAAVSVEADYIITNDVNGFRRSPIPVLTPGAYVDAFYAP